MDRKLAPDFFGEKLRNGEMPPCVRQMGNYMEFCDPDNGNHYVTRFSDDHTSMAIFDREGTLLHTEGLMPLDDFRRQIADRAKVDLDLIEHCRDRYRVSLIATILRWLSYTEKRAVVVVSRDGFILWARSSTLALKTGAFYRTSAGPIEIPATSLAVQQDRVVDGRGTADHDPGVWFNEPVREMTVVAEQYDFVISLLLLHDDGGSWVLDEESETDTYDRLTPIARRRDW